MLWVHFVLAAGLIVFAGIKLTVFVDVLGDRLGWGKVWLGVALLGVVTSLPEAVTSLTAVSLGAVDLAVGNMVGSNNFNLFLFFLMDCVYRGGPVTDVLTLRKDTLLPAAGAAVLTGLVVLAVLHPAWTTVGVGPFGLGEVLLIGGYVVGIRMTAGGRGGTSLTTPVPEETARRPIPTLCLHIFFSAALVVLGSVWLTQTADRLAEVTGLGETFFGTIFLAAATSLPEMVVTISAVKLGGLGLAVGNIFGSNMVNMFLLGLCDVVYPGSLFAGVSPRHALTAAASLLLTGVVLAGMARTGKRAWWGVGWDTWVVGLSVLGGTVVWFFLR